MTGTSAMKIAVSLLHLPADVRRVRQDPLPCDVSTVLRIASGDEEMERHVASHLDRPRPLIREAAVFYIEQILLHPGADHYRVLGSSPTAAAHDLRRNMALLLSWLHPDKNPAGDRSILAARVTGAWDVLRSPQRRTAYDLSLQTQPSHRGKRGRTGPQTGPQSLFASRNHASSNQNGSATAARAHGARGGGRGAEGDEGLLIRLLRRMADLRQRWRQSAKLKRQR